MKQAAQRNRWPAQASARSPTPLPAIRRTAFSLVEALVAITLLAVAGMLLLLATEGIINTSQEMHERMLADALARQLLDEILHRPLQPPPLGVPTTVDPSRRITFSTVWDYDGYHAEPPVDPWGIPCGRGDGKGGERPPSFQVPAAWYAGFERRVTVRYVDPTDPRVALGAGQTSPLLRITVTVVRRDPNGAVRPLARHASLVPEPGLGGW